MAWTTLTLSFYGILNVFIVQAPEGLTRDKHTSLFCTFVYYWGETFVNNGSWLKLGMFCLVVSDEGKSFIASAPRRGRQTDARPIPGTRASTHGQRTIFLSALNVD